MRFLQEKSEYRNFFCKEKKDTILPVLSEFEEDNSENENYSNSVVNHKKIDVIHKEEKALDSNQVIGCFSKNTFAVEKVYDGNHLIGFEISLFHYASTSPGINKISNFSKKQYHHVSSISKLQMNNDIAKNKNIYIVDSSPHTLNHSINANKSYVHTTQTSSTQTIGNSISVSAGVSEKGLDFSATSTHSENNSTINEYGNQMSNSHSYPLKDWEFINNTKSPHLLEWIWSQTGPSDLYKSYLNHGNNIAFEKAYNKDEMNLKLSSDLTSDVFKEDFDKIYLSMFSRLAFSTFTRSANTKWFVPIFKENSIELEFDMELITIISKIGFKDIPKSKQVPNQVDMSFGEYYEAKYEELGLGIMILYLDYLVKKPKKTVYKTIYYTIKQFFVNNKKISSGTKKINLLLTRDGFFANKRIITLE